MIVDLSKMTPHTRRRVLIALIGLNLETIADHIHVSERDLRDFLRTAGMEKRVDAALEKMLRGYIDESRNYIID